MTEGRRLRWLAPALACTLFFAADETRAEALERGAAVPPSAIDSLFEPAAPASFLTRGEPRFAPHDGAVASVLKDTIDTHPSLALALHNAATASGDKDAALLFEDLHDNVPPDDLSDEAELADNDETADADDRGMSLASLLDAPITYLESEAGGVAFVPVEERPKNWPILPEEGGPDGYADIDPLRPLNIVIFYANGALDYIILEPLAKTYAAIMPDEAEAALSRAFDNLAAPVTFINDLLQLEFENAGITLARFVLNSTVGVGGLIDVAVNAGLPPHKADFGQTLHRYGVGDGIYLVLPLFGGTTLRDAVGLGVDILISPRGLVFDDSVSLGLSIGEAIVRRAEYIGPADFLEAYAQNHYEAARAWTYQRRERFLSEGCDQPSLIICIGDFSK